LTIINTGEVNLREYQVLVNLDTRALVSAGKMRKDGADLRFVDENGKELPYWIESGLGTRNTEIWVRVPSIPLSDGSRIHIYYGNPDSGAGANGSLTFEFYSPFERRRKLDLGEGFLRQTMKEPLTIPSYEARGVVHPDVVYFPDGVDGYMYWMYYTPYPPDKYELPRLVRSRDGLNFTNEGTEHLLLEAGESGQWDDGFLADPDILKLGDKWYLFYAGRSANKSWQKVGLATSNDGIHFTKHPLNPILEADLDLEYESHDYLLSPTLYHNESGFYMWYFAEGREGNRTKIWMCGAKSENGTHWEKLPQNPLLAPQPASLDQKGIWHGDVIRFSDHFWLYYVAYDGSEYHISLAKSRNGVEWGRSDENPVLDTRPNSWEGLRMYRSSAVVVDDELRLYYSAFNSSPNGR
jgi:sucrose-6-phosphate hydrolase SacC (GH32 family)